MDAGKNKFSGSCNNETTHQPPPQPDNVPAYGGFDEIPVRDAATAMEEYNQQKRRLEKGKEILQQEENEEDFEEGYDYYKDGGEEDRERSLYEGNGSGDEEEDGADERPMLPEGFFEIEAVRKKRTRKGVAQYYIKWRDWPEKDNTWEPLVNLQSCSDVIEAFESSLKSSKGKAGRKCKRKHRVTPQPSSNKRTQQQQPHQRKQREKSPAKEDNFSVSPKMDSLNAVEMDVVAKEGDENEVVAVSPPQQTDKEGHGQNLNVSVHVQEHVAHSAGATCTNGTPIVDGNEANQYDRRIGASRSKSGAVKCFNPDSSSHEADEAEDATIRTESTNGNALNPEITEIIKAIELSTTSSASNNTRDVTINFQAKRADGTEVFVDNKFLKAKYPLLLIDFYEKHLRHSSGPTE